VLAWIFRLLVSRILYVCTVFVLLALFSTRLFSFLFAPFPARLFVFSTWGLVLRSCRIVFGSGGGFVTVEIARGCSVGVVVVVTVDVGAVLGWWWW
jgi:hypothetical protein